MGYRTETACDGIEGWEKAQAWEPAIVVTDLKMPRLDGIGLLGKLSAENSGLSSNLAVVVLTAMGSIQLAVDAMKLGAYDFLQKPVDATRLKTILANARGSAIQPLNSKWRAAVCAKPACWAPWWAAPGPCAKSSD